MPYSRAEVLGEALGAFELRRGARRTEHLDARRFEIVGEPRHQRRLGPDHHEADSRCPCRSERPPHGPPTSSATHSAISVDAGIARRAIERVEERALLELPGERVLAPAAAYQQHVHQKQAPLVSRRRG